jgi:hypothetical protein
MFGAFDTSAEPMAVALACTAAEPEVRQISPRWCVPSVAGCWECMLWLRWECECQRGNPNRPPHTRIYHFTKTAMTEARHR